MKKRILTIDGGGVLGIGPLAMLQQMDIAGMAVFHALAGTSTGAILVALYLVTGSWRQAFEIFNTNYRDIFKQPWNYKIDPLPRALQPHPKYDGKALAALLKKHLGDRKCSDFPLIPFFIPAFNWRTGRVKVWGNKDGDLLREAVLASTAAPGYFPPASSPETAQGPALWADGGLAANNPAMVALAGCIRLHGWDLQECYILSLGTGGDYWQDPKVSGSTPLAALAEPVINSQFMGTEEMVNYQAGAFLLSRFLRVEPILSSGYALDYIGSAQEYAALWRGLYNQRKDDILTWWRNSDDAS